MEPASPPDVEGREFLRRVAAGVLLRAVEDARGIAANPAIQAQARSWLRRGDAEPWCALAKVRASRLRRRVEKVIAEPKPRKARARRAEPRNPKPPRDPLAGLRDVLGHHVRAVGSEPGAREWIVSELTRSARRLSLTRDELEAMVDTALLETAKKE